MISRTIHTVKQYIAVSRNLAHHDGTDFAKVLSRILMSRIFFGMGPDIYNLRRFSKKRLRQTREYLSLREREDLQKILCPKEAWGLVENKLRFYERCNLHGLPTPRIFGVLLVRDFHVPDGLPVVKSRQEFLNIFSGLPTGQYVVKPIDGGHGWGVSAVRVGNGRVTNLNGETIDLDEFFRQCTESPDQSAGFLVQEFVRPHRMLKTIMPGPGLGTFRVVSFLTRDGRVNIPYAVVKIPVGANLIDNFDAGGSGNWVCPVDVATGCLGNAVGKSPSVPVVSEMEKHLETGAVFREIVVPGWEEVKSTIVKAAQAFSELRMIGWDVAVTDSGANILEANWDWGENIIEVAHDRGLRFELTEIANNARLTVPGEA
jgi:glutathione synthase/RimK-type ligase-like ATP-grasp enzyme